MSVDVDYSSLFIYLFVLFWKSGVWYSLRSKFNQTKMARNLDFASYCNNLLNDPNDLMNFDNLSRDSPMETLVYYDLQPVSEPINKEWVVRLDLVFLEKKSFTKIMRKQNINNVNIFRSSCPQSFCDNMQSGSRLSTSTVDLNIDASGNEHMKNKIKGSTQWVFIIVTDNSIMYN